MTNLAIYRPWDLARWLHSLLPMNTDKIRWNKGADLEDGTRRYDSGCGRFYIIRRPRCSSCLRDSRACYRAFYSDDDTQIGFCRDTLAVSKWTVQNRTAR